MINPIVLSEFAWTLSRSFKLSRESVAGHLDDVLEADDLEVAFRAAATRAIAAYRAGRADFPDYFLACINSELGCRTTVTFDQAARDFTEFSPVP